MTEWKDILPGCLKGQHREQALAYRQVWKQVYPAVYNLVRHREEAEDILQESILHGFERLKDLNDASKYPAWQRQISVRMALTRLREKRKLELEFPDLPLVSPADEEDGTPDFEQASRQLEKLPEGYRLVVSLHLLEGMSHEEVGQALGIRASTSRSQYSRALSRLKHELTNTHEQPI